MTWIQRYRVRQYLRDSIWILPSVGMLAAIAAARLVMAIDAAMGWQSGLHPDAAQSVLATLATSMFAIVVFVCSSLLVALQIASGQLTPRIIALVFRDPTIKWSMALFAFSFTFAISVALRIERTVPWLAALVSGYGCAASLIAFFYLIGHLGQRLRPSEVLRYVAHYGRLVIEEAYPSQLTESAGVAPKPARWPEGEPVCSVPAQRDGVVRACDIPGIVALAQRADCALEMVPQVGDFISAGNPLFRVFGNSNQALVRQLGDMVAIGHERSIEQDPAFAFRIMVDIASKALSPAINDPTTAVLAIDQVHHLLRHLSNRNLDDERVRDSTGRLRLLYRTPGWDDFVHLAVTEIRQFGGESIQVTRRLRGMLERLMGIVPKERAGLLRIELDLLNRSAARGFKEPEDQALAAIGDSQGVGGTAARRNGAAMPGEEEIAEEPRRKAHR